MKTRLVMVMTVDGVIAKSADHNPMKWSSKEDKQLFIETSKQAGVMIMGKNTFDAIGKPLPDRLTVVLTREERIDIPNKLEYKKGDIKEVLAELEFRGYKLALICGGTFVNSKFLQENLIDEVQITIEPQIFGSGLRIFDKIEVDTKLELISVEKINQNSINLLYRIIK